MPTYYAFTRRMNPAKGQPVIVDGTWDGGAPMAEIAVRVLRTPKGSYKPTPTFGVDYTGIDKGLPSAEAKLTGAIESAFAFYVRTGLMVKLIVKVERAGSRLRYEVSFDDPRMMSGGRVGPIRGQV
jgi:hypothetical protein